MKSRKRGRTSEGAALSRVPKWIDWIPRGGWPVVAVVVMVMCAPGEHYLAVMAGWDHRLAWGMPACLVAYAGIAASVATRRARGSQGRLTAVVGAFTSLGAAMAAQPVSHMFVTQHWSSQPSPAWIVWAVSLVPPLVLGHLMHMAASHSVRSEAAAASQPEVSQPTPSEAPRGVSGTASQGVSPSQPKVSQGTSQLTARLKAGETISAQQAADLLGVSRATGGRRLSEARAELSKVNGSP